MLIKSPIEVKINQNGESYSFQTMDRFFYVNKDELYIFKSESDLKKQLKGDKTTPESKRDISEHFAGKENQRGVFFFIKEKVYFMNIQYKKSKAYISELIQTRYTFKTENVIK